MKVVLQFGSDPLLRFSTRGFAGFPYNQTEAAGPNMRKRVIYGSAVLLMVMLLTLLVWQASFSFGDFGPTSPQQTYLVWAVSTLIFLLTVTLGFMLFRNFVKLYIERH